MMNASGSREIDNPGRQYFPAKTVRIGLSGPVVAQLKPFEEKGLLGVEVSTTENLDWSKDVTDKVSKEFHDLVGEMLKKHEDRRVNAYTKGKSNSKSFHYQGTFYIIPTDDGASGLSLIASTYSQGRIDSLTEMGGEDIFYKGRLQNVMEWAGRHPGWARFIKVATVIGLVAGAAYLGFQADHAMDIMAANRADAEMMQLVRDAIITDSSDVTKITAAYSAFNGAIPVAVGSSAGAGACAAGAVAVTAHPLRTKGQKVKLSPADKQIGMYLQDQGMYKVLPVNAELTHYTPRFQK